MPQFILIEAALGVIVLFLWLVWVGWWVFLLVAAVYALYWIVSEHNKARMDAVARDNERLSYERQKLVHAKARLAEDAAIKAWQDYYPTHMRYMHARDQWKKACTAWEDEKKQTARALELWKINLENRVNEFVYRVTIHGGHKTDKQMLDMFFSIYPDSCFPPQFPEIEKPVEPRAERPPPKIAYDSEWGSFESWKLINNVPYPQKRRY